MQKFHTTLIAITVLVGCAASEPGTQKSDIYAWGSDTIDGLIEIHPQTFKEMSVKARLPDNFNYSERTLSYDPNSNMQVSLDQADKKFVRDAGIISSIAEFCGLNWADENFFPMMQWQRDQVASSEQYGYQIAVVGLIHGYAQGQTDQWLEENDAKCDQVQNLLKGNLFSNNF